MIGNGAHATDMLDSFAHRWVDRDWRHPAQFRQFAHHSLVGEFRYDETTIYIGINNPWERLRISEELGRADESWEHHTVIANRSTWGHGTHINYGVTMTRTTIGHHCTISPGVTICGDVTIGDRVLVGAGATICDRVTIGNDVTIGAGAVVLPETVVPDGETWVGVPAREKNAGRLFPFGGDTTQRDHNGNPINF